MRPNPRVDEEMAKKGYLSVPEAARRSQLPTSTLYDAIRAKRLPVKLVGRRKYVAIKDLLDFGGDGVRLLFTK